MSHARLRPMGPPDGPVALRDDGGDALDASALAEAARSLTSETGFVLIDGPGPTRHPGLIDAVAVLVSRGLRPILVTGAASLGVDGATAWRDRGVAIQRLRVDGPPDEDPAGWAVVRHAAALDHLLVEVVAPWTAKAEARWPAIGRACAALGVTMRGVAGPGASPAAEEQALTALVGLIDAGLDVALEGFGRAPPVSGPREVTAGARSAWTLLSAHAPVRALYAGCLAAVQDAAALRALADEAGGPGSLARWLAAWGCPLVDVSRGWGGVGEETAPSWTEAFGAPPVPPLIATPAPGRRVVVVGGGVVEPVLLLSTLPSLVDALGAAGATARLEATFPALVGHPEVAPGGAWTQAVRGAAEAEAALWARLDLADADVVVVCDLASAVRAHGHPTRRRGARIVVLDTHFRQGVDAIEAAGWAGEGWPADVVVLSAFPGHAGIWRFGDVPARAIGWTPYPVAAGAWAQGPAPSRCEAFSAAGNARRDFALLGRAAALLGPSGPRIDVRTHHAPPTPLPPPLHHVGTVPLPDFVAGLASSRAVVVPVRADPLRSAGITVVQLAKAVGRPVIATAIAGTVDHVRHGVDGILVPPHDPRALAAAIHRLATDDALADRLGRGAQEAARRDGVEALATRILQGADGAAVARPGGGWASW